MAEMIPAQVHQDIEDIGKAVNTDAIITPRYGAPFKSLPMIEREAFADILDLRENKADKVEVDTALQAKANADDVYSKELTYTKAEVDTTFAAYVGGRKAYTTLALAQAAQSSLPANTAIEVTNDGANNGTYQWNGTTLTKSAYDPLTQAKADATQKANDAKAYTDNKTAPLAELTLSKTETNSTVIPVLVDKSNKILIGYDTEVDQIVAGGLQEQIFNKVPNLMLSTDTNKVAVLVDQNNKILIGYDTLEDKAIIAGLELPNLKPAVKAVNHILFYGQSLSIGAAGNPPLSTSQPYSNITFNSSVRFLNQAATGVKPLSEETGIAALPSTTNQGETACSGAANYASRAMMLENSIAPENHVIFASTGGYGGYRIDQLEKGSAWYPNFINHVVKAKELVGDDYKVQVVCWVQGENDAVTSQKTPYATYKQKLEQLQRDTNADIKAITGQADDVKFITYQISYAARTWSAQALAQLHLVQQSDNFALSTPMYHMPYAEDNIHLTNVGYKWMGAYFGRAYKQIVVDNRKPDFINPKSAQIINDEIHIKFDVPKPPLVLDTTTLAITTNHGFRVLVDDVAAVISNITATDNKVIIKLSSPPSGLVKVRYALDHIGTGINLTGGGSGNLRDSTPETIFINGIERPLYHVCPHFELTAFLDKGI